MTQSPRDVLAMLRTLPDRLNDDQLALVTRIAYAPLPDLPKANAEQFAACLRRMAVLPRRADDDSKGEQRVKIFARLLGDYPLEALGFMTRVVLERCTFHPVPAECLAILKERGRADDAPKAQALAFRIADDERRARLADLAKRCEILTQPEIDALPDSVKRSLENKCKLWRLPSGRYIPRTCSWPEALALDESAAA